MRLVALRKRHQNDAVSDPWTIVHFAVGLAFGLTETHAGAALSGAVGYELAEQWAERKEPTQELLNVSGPESIPNAMMDVVVFGVGYALGRLYNRT